MNYCRELKSQTEEAVRLRQLAHLSKGIKKGKGMTAKTQIGEWKKGNKETTLVEDPIFMIQRSDSNIKRKITKHELNKVREITFPFLSTRLKPSIRSMRVDSKIPIFGFSREHSWPLGEIPFEITIREGLLTTAETLKCVILKYESLCNLIIRAKFRNLGTTLESKIIVRKLLNSVPKKFLPIVETIEQYQDLDKMSFEEVVRRLTAFEDRIKSQDTLEVDNQDKLLLASSNNQSHGKGRGKNFNNKAKENMKWKNSPNAHGTSTNQGTKNKSTFRCYECGDFNHFARNKLEEDLVTYFQNFQNTSESSDDSTNVVNAPREPVVVKQDHGINPSHIDKCCCECGNALDGIYCQQCICKSCGKGAHTGYNCPPKVSIISNPEPCNQTMNNELPQTLPSFDSTCYSDKENSVPYVSKPNFVEESFSIFNPPPQPPIYSCEFCGSNAQYGHYCTPQAPFINPEPGYSQDFNFPQNIHDF
nr:zinc finger, CCHC-type [Tanacetum cinerariifolium]